MPLEWTAETLRLSLFFPEAVRTTVADWSKVTGQDRQALLHHIELGADRYFFQRHSHLNVARQAGIPNAGFARAAMNSV